MPPAIIAIRPYATDKLVGFGDAGVFASGKGIFHAGGGLYCGGGGDIQSLFHLHFLFAGFTPPAGRGGGWGYRENSVRCSYFNYKPTLGGGTSGLGAAAVK